MQEEQGRNQKEKRRFSRTALHNEEERIKHAFRDQIAEMAGLLEVFISIVVLVGLIFSAVPMLQWMPGLLVDGNEVEVHTFLERALDIVIGIEFIKMLAKHSPGSSLEVLLYAIARHMVVGQDSAMESLISVVAIGLIFIIRKYFFVSAFGSTAPGSRIFREKARQPAPKEPEHTGS